MYRAQARLLSCCPAGVRRRRPLCRGVARQRHSLVATELSWLAWQVFSSPSSWQSYFIAYDTGIAISWQSASFARQRSALAAGSMASSTPHIWKSST
jgi:hypothetical protein